MKFYLDGKELCDVTSLSVDDGTTKSYFESEWEEPAFISPPIDENGGDAFPPLVEGHYVFEATKILTRDRDWNAMKALDDFWAEWRKR